MRGFNYRGSDLAVVRRDDQNVKALGQETLRLIHLGGIAAVGDQHFAYRSDFFTALLDQSFVALPTLFLHSVHLKSDSHRAAGFGAALCTLLLAIHAIICL